MRAISRCFSLFLVSGVLLWITVGSSVQAGEIKAEVESSLQGISGTETISVIVHMSAQANLQAAIAGKEGNRVARGKAVVETLRSTAAASQQGIIAYLRKMQAEGLVKKFKSYWGFNGLAVTATEEVIREIGARADVGFVSLDKPIPPPEPVPTESELAPNASEWNINKVRAPEVWAMGYDGTGLVVGSFDTGVDWNHPDISAKYRGGSNSWFDPYAQHGTPYDYHGHGTHTTGTMLGGNAGGTDIGVAPGAKWIAAKAWRDDGWGGTAEFHAIFQWFLDPDGNSNTDDFPDAVNNSWGIDAPGCYNDFKADVLAWVAAGIFPSFAAGNSGPGAGSVISPGNHSWNGAEIVSFAVGATSSSDVIAGFSSRGPSPCNQETKPEVSAPGVSIKSSLPGNSYGSWNGTSMATPHVTGAIALLLQCNPALTVKQLGDILQNTAVDLGSPGEDNNYGSGRIDIYAAVSNYCGSQSIAPDGVINHVRLRRVICKNRTTRQRVIGTVNPDGSWTCTDVFRQSDGDRVIIKLKGNSVDVQCVGQICGTYTPDCDPNIQPCYCFKLADGSTICADDFYCSHPGCTTNADCASGLCVVDACCGSPGICHPTGTCTGNTVGVSGGGGSAIGN